MKLSFEQMYKAVIDKDINYEGIFYRALKTTRIFCRPSCTTKKTKPENIEFFKTTKDCILKGYRACKVCYPLIHCHHVIGTDGNLTGYSGGIRQKKWF
ncbi:MGMT family protein [Olivibacter jilunii]